MIERLLASFIGMAAAAYTEKEATLQQSYSRPALITRAFRQLVSRHYCEMKQPAAYATELHLSLSYLNEVVKATTGFPVTYWIHHEIMLEARRLLYYSDLSVKEIAHRVGYDDHTYFSRLFHKIVNTTPLRFRKRYRE
jgi:AraC-like DNA-binding protein